MMMQLAAELYPICRSITGNGVRESLRILQRCVPLEIREVPTGTRVFDWEVPAEWNIRAAWIKDGAGRTVVDFQNHNLHVVNYSRPVRARLSLDELRPHLFSLPEHPHWIPYRTTYYRDTWGFCLPHRLLTSLDDGEYEVCVDTSLEPGNLSYGELVVPGQTTDEVLFSCHSCHPSLANDNLSGMVVAAHLAASLRQRQNRLTYRFLWLPGTIGAITWLAQNESVVPRIRAGLVLSCVGDSGPFTYKKSRRGDAEIDQIMSHLLSPESGDRLIDFTPIGYDERQYCSPGFNLPVGCFMRTPNGCFPEYHTSADNLDFIKSESLAGSLQMLQRVVAVLEQNRFCQNLNPKCEPQLGRRGLYRALGGQSNTGLEQALLWVLNFSDGRHSLLDIAKRSGSPFATIAQAATLLEQHELLVSETPSPASGR